MTPLKTFPHVEANILSDKPSPPPLHELEKLRTPIRQVNVEHRKALSPLERVAILLHLEAQNDLIVKILHHLEGVSNG